MPSKSSSSDSALSQRRIRIAVIGLGLRASHMLKVMSQIDPNICIAAVVDPAGESAVLDKLREQDLQYEKPLGVFADLERYLDRGDEVDGLLIGTRCDLHTPLMIRLAEIELPLFLEKPVAISWEQLQGLNEAYAPVEDSRVVVSFPLSRTPIFDAAHEVVHSGRLGQINQVQAVNNVAYGEVYIDSWYRDDSITGGMWLQKATHDFDYIHRLAGACPTQVSAMEGRKIWQSRTGNHDAGSALVCYDNGLHACYSQNFLTRKSAGVRGATVTGEDATLRFDWNRKSLRITNHRDDRIDNIHISDAGGHGGGDERLARNFLNVVRGEAQSQTPLSTGLLSAATCLAVRDAATRGTVESIPDWLRSPPGPNG